MVNKPRWPFCRFETKSYPDVIVFREKSDSASRISKLKKRTSFFISWFRALGLNKIYLRDAMLTVTIMRSRNCCNTYFVELIKSRSLTCASSKTYSSHLGYDYFFLSSNFSIANFYEITEDEHIYAIRH